MKTPVKLGVFGLGLVVLFAAAWWGGRLAAPGTAAKTAPEGGAHGMGHGATPSAVPGTSIVELPGGLQVSQDGFRLEPTGIDLSTVEQQSFQFRIIGPDGRPVTAYTKAHEKDLHLIVVRRDMTGFQHIHPTMSGDGLWSVPLQVSAPGQYRVFADFQPASRTTNLILGVDVAAPGDYQPQALPASTRTTTIDGYAVTIAGDLIPGTSSKLTLSVSKDGKPVTDLQPYLGAYGHLVALRDGDLAYLHVHPEEGLAGPEVVFFAEVPSTGNYGLFLDFQHGGKVRTAQFTATSK